MTLFFPPSFSSYFLHFCVAKSFVTVQVRDAKMPPPSQLFFSLGMKGTKSNRCYFTIKRNAGMYF